MMIKNAFVAVVVMVLCATTIFAGVEEPYLKANGYDWLRYSNHEKHTCAMAIIASLKLNISPNNPAKIVRALDRFYNRAVYEENKNPGRTNADVALHLTCVEVIQLGRIREANEACKRKLREQ
jgi:hypothetical protein